MAEPTTEAGRRLLGWFGPEYEPTYREQLGIILAIEQEAASAAVAEVLDRLPDAIATTDTGHAWLPEGLEVETAAEWLRAALLAESREEARRG